MKVRIYYKQETRLDDETLNNVDEIISHDSDIEFTYNNSITQYEQGIRVIKKIPKKLLHGFNTYF